MGYEAALHLVDVKIKNDSVPTVTKILKTKKARGLGPPKCFLEEAFLADDGFLCFKPTGRFLSLYEPVDDGTVTAMGGKWYDAEKIAQWLKIHSAKGGRLILHSLEADGAAWGWEFDGKGRLRELDLCSVGKWM